MTCIFRKVACICIVVMIFCLFPLSTYAASTTGNEDLWSRFSLENILLSFVVTITIYSLPIIIYRYAIKKEPVEPQKAKRITIIYGIVAFIVMTALIIALNGSGAASGAIVLWSCINYRMLVGGDKNSIKTRIVEEKTEPDIVHDDASEIPSVNTETSMPPYSDVSVFTSPHSSPISVPEIQVCDAPKIETKTKKQKNDDGLHITIKWSHLIYAGIIVLLVVAGTTVSILLSNASYAAGSKYGEDTGYQTGYQTGYHDGYQKGHSDGKPSDDMMSEYLFYHSSAVVVHDGSDYYHTYNKCNTIKELFGDGGAYYIFNSEYAKYLGYKPCPVCFPND